MADAKPNTNVSYMYRDAGNWKAHESVVVAGHLDMDDLLACCFTKEFFIPSQVGLTDLQDKMEGFPNDLDHVWHELSSVEGTDEPPTIEATAGELLNRFQVAKDHWKVSETMQQLGLY